MKKLLFLIVFLMCPTLLYSDIIYFKDGTSIEGEITEENDDLIAVREEINPAVTKVSYYPKSDIARIERETSGEALKSAGEAIDVKDKQIRIQVPEVKKTVRKETVSPAESITEESDKSEGLKYNLLMCKDKSLAEPLKMKRTECTIVVPNYATNRELKLIFLEVLKEMLVLSKDLDALWIITYTQGTGINGLPLAYGIWSPPNGWDDFNNISDKSKYRWNYRFLYE